MMGSSGETPQSASVENIRTLVISWTPYDNKSVVSYASYNSLNPSRMRVIETAHPIL